MICSKSEKVLALHPLPLDRDLLLDGLLLHTEWSLGHGGQMTKNVEN